VSGGRPSSRERPAPKGLRRLERWLVGLVMAVLAYVLEKAVIRSIRKGRTSPPAQTETTTFTGTGTEITSE
jgi:hypothetical protein